MQSYTQTFASAQTWTLNVPGKFFTVLACNTNVNIRLYKNSKRLDLGEIVNIGAGIEIGGFNSGVDFDKVEIDIAGADTVQVGIGNGQARYNRNVSNTIMLTNKQSQSGSLVNAAATVGLASGTLLAANTARQYLLVQNTGNSGNIFITFGAGAATLTTGIKIAPGGFYEQTDLISTQAVQAIGDAAGIPAVVVQG